MTSLDCRAVSEKMPQMDIFIQVAIVLKLHENIFFKAESKGNLMRYKSLILVI